MSDPSPTRSATRKHIVEVAESLFYQKGVRTVGIDEIISIANIAKATLYSHFHSKENLIVASLEARKARLEAQFDKAATGGGPSVTEQIMAVFAALEQTLDDRDFRGCAFMMALADHVESSKIAEVSRQYKISIRDRFYRLIQDFTPSPGPISEQLSLLYEGAVAVATVRPEARPAHHAMRCAELLLTDGNASAHGAAAYPPSRSRSRPMARQTKQTSKRS